MSLYRDVYLLIGYCSPELNIWYQPPAVPGSHSGTENKATSCPSPTWHECDGVGSKKSFRRKPSLPDNQEVACKNSLEIRGLGTMVAAAAGHPVRVFILDY